jgi:hypothetical protein
MNFLSYNRIEESTSKWTINEKTLNKTKWVVTEKIHGGT